MGRFITAINCMDGRVQLPVIEYLRDRYDADFVDMITEAGPCGAMAGALEGPIAGSIMKRVRVSVEKHLSIGVFIAAHDDCAGNLVDAPAQKEHLREALAVIRSREGMPPLTGALWIGPDMRVTELIPPAPDRQ